MPSDAVQRVINADIDNLISVFLNNKEIEAGKHDAENFDALIEDLETAKDKSAIERAVIFNSVLKNVQILFDQDPLLAQTLSEIIQLAENKIYHRAPAEEWVQHIGEYDLSQEAQAILQRETEAPPIEEFDAHQAVHALLSSDESRTLLYTGAFAEGEEQTNARDTFLRFLENRHLNLPQENTRPRPTTDMKLFLGEEGVRLYKAAVNEEMRSRSFRDAVFLKSVQHYEGQKWDKKLVLWVGGPSASGKTYGASSAVKAMAEKMPSLEGDESGNYVVSVDGGIEREVSQMRQMLLQAALTKGYKGISDLHANTKLSVKEYVKAAALEEDSLSLVIPETFAESALLKRFDAAGAYKENEMRAYHQDPRIIQAFSEVVAETSKDERFKISVKHMGEGRAWFNERDEFDDDSIKMNNREIGCESKVYDSKGFFIGRYASEQAREILKEMDPNGSYIRIVNDLVFVKKDQSGKWRECGSDDTPDFKLAARDFEKWKSERRGDLNTHDLKEWYAEQRQQGHLAKANIMIVPNDIVNIEVKSKENPDVKGLKISKRDYDRFLAEIHPEKPSFARVTGWCLDQAEIGKLITPLDLIVQYKEGVMRRTVSAPAFMERSAQKTILEAEPIPRTSSAPIPIPKAKVEEREQASFKNHLTFSYDSMPESVENTKLQAQIEKKSQVDLDVEPKTAQKLKSGPSK
ncbi:hypothetical protein CC99x_004215 [Candidatus Berkiella cookevillensis]|uniref:Uncharacterized protein n=1 Tax=Candidatus Berkiella cookevillensis TaxID=437022 RepID=A0A0Q9YND8_9GAMM|nr:hypothetical protein [Candidatus Berkiella cookevillensis]MCS5708103.1 hypothetical protein [Candidatus Berkiella cookevillensis]